MTVRPPFLFILSIFLLICTTSFSFQQRRSRRPPVSLSSTSAKFSSVILSEPEKSLPENVSSVEDIHDNKQVSLTCVASDPLLFVSKSPMLTATQCDSLLKWCNDISSDNNGSINSSILEALLSAGERGGGGGSLEDTDGVTILKTLQKRIHHEVLNLVDSDYVVPRFLSYGKESENNNAASSLPSVDTLLPDGLHVDTNNNKHARHWTVLFYLTSSDSGATTFPLADPSFLESCQEMDGVHLAGMARKSQQPRMPTSLFRDDSSELTKSSDDSSKLAAKNLLLNHDLHHTRVSTNEKMLDLGRMVEEKAVELFQNQDTAESGIRILPRKGHICVFSGLKHDGFPNPMSFHGSESLCPGDRKNVLTFFYEVPMSSFSSRETLGQQVQERENNFLQQHVQNLRP